MFARAFRERGIHAHTGQPIVEVQQGSLRDAAGATHAADEILWTTEAAAAAWIRESGLAADDHGFVRIRPTLESVSHPGVFAAGDVASLVGHRLEKSGVYAVREGQTLAPNLRSALEGTPLRQYRPQRRFLSLISTGDRFAIASRGPVAVQGRWLWRWKDRIDRRFMAQYKDLPA